MSGFSNIFSAQEATKSHFGSIELLCDCLFPILFFRITFFTWLKDLSSVKGHHFEFYWHRWPKQHFPALFSNLEVIITWPALISYFQWYSLLAFWSFWKKSVLSYVSASQSFVHPSKSAVTILLGDHVSSLLCNKRKNELLQSSGSQVIFFLVLV